MTVWSRSADRPSVVEGQAWLLRGPWPSRAGFRGARRRHRPCAPERGRPWAARSIAEIAAIRTVRRSRRKGPVTPAYGWSQDRGLACAGILGPGPQAAKSRQTGTNRRPPPPTAGPCRSSSGDLHSTALGPAHPDRVYPVARAHRDRWSSVPRCPRAPPAVAAHTTVIAPPSAMFRQRGGKDLAGTHERRPAGVHPSVTSLDRHSH